MSVTNIAFLRARPGQEDRLGQQLLRLADLARSDQGCQLSNLHRNDEDPALWFLYESWISQEALWSHLGTSEVQGFLEIAEALIENDFGLRSFRLVPSMAQARDRIEPIGLAA